MNYEIYLELYQLNYEIHETNTQSNMKFMET